ncbi:MAG: hypothetical protein WD048_16850 [Chitinophagales bacterium]
MTVSLSQLDIAFQKQLDFSRVTVINDFTNQGKPIFALCFVLLMLTGCKFFNSTEIDENRIALARSGEKVLYHDQVVGIIKEGSSKKDSLDKLQTITRNWIKKQLILEKVALYLPEEKQTIEKQVQDYRESLLTALYEEELVRQKLDTLVTNEELSAFYEVNRSNFLLRYPAYQIYYIIVAQEAPKLDSLRFWVTNIEQHKEKLSAYCYTFAEDFSLKDSIWIENQLLLSKFPLENEIIQRLRRTKQTEELADSDYFYYLKVNDWKDQGELAPIELVKNDIKKLILNKRKLKLIEQAHDQIYQEAIKKGKFEIY